MTVARGHTTRVVFDAALHCTRPSRALHVEISGMGRVLVDGREVGVAPVVGVPISTGSHRLEVRSEARLLLSTGITCRESERCGVFMFAPTDPGALR